MKSLVLSAIAAAFLFGCTETGNQRVDQQGETIVGQVKARAQDDVCRSNLSSIRQSIAVYRTNGDDAYPPAMTDLKLPASMLYCPIDKEPYTYDSTTGEVKCHHPGHSKY